VRLKHESARDARNDLNISGNGEKYLCLERPVFDICTRLFSIVRFTHELQLTTLAQRGRLEGNAGAGDSCTLDGDRKFQGSGPGFDPYSGCE